MIEIPIIFCFDKNYIIPASVAFYSLLENTAKDIAEINWGGAALSQKAKLP